MTPGLTLLMDIITDPGYSSIMNPDMALGSSLEIDITMAPRTAQVIQLRMALAAAWLSDTNTDSGGWPEPGHMQRPWWEEEPRTSPLTQTNAGHGPRYGRRQQPGSDVWIAPCDSTGYQRECGLYSSRMAIKHQDYLKWLIRSQWLELTPKFYVLFLFEFHL